MRQLAIWVLMLLCMMPIAANAQQLAQYYDCKEELFVARDNATKLFGYKNMENRFIIMAGYKQAFPFQGRYAIVRPKTKFGMIDCEGNLAIPDIFDAFRCFYFNRGYALKDGKWLLLDNTGRQLQPNGFNDVLPIDERGPKAWVNKDDQWGLFDKDQNQFSVQPQYGNVSVLSDSVAVVKIVATGLSSFVSNLGPATYIDSVQQFKVLPDNAIAFKCGSKWGLLTKAGKQRIKPAYDSIAFAGNQCYKIFLNKKVGLWRRDAIFLPVAYAAFGEAVNQWLPVKKENGTWQYQSTTSNKAVGTFGSASNLYRDGAVVTLPNGSKQLYRPGTNSYLLPKPALKINFIASLGLYAVDTAKLHTVILKYDGSPYNSQLYDTIYSSDSTHQMRAVVGKNVGFLNLPLSTKSQTWLVPPAYQSASAMQGGFASVSLGTGKAGVINNIGKVIVGTQYDSVSLFHGGNAIVFKPYKSSLCGIIATNGTVVIPVVYTLIVDAGVNFKTQKDGLFGINAHNGTVLLPPTFKAISNSANNPTNLCQYPAIATLTDQRQTLIGNKGQDLLTKSYQVITAIGSCLYTFKDGNRMGMLAKNGSEVYTDMVAIGPADQSMVLLNKDGKYGFGNDGGQVVVPCIYDGAAPFRNKVAFVKQGNKWAAITSKGRLLTKFIYDGYNTDVSTKARKLYINTSK